MPLVPLRDDEFQAFMFERTDLSQGLPSCLGWDMFHLLQVPQVAGGAVVHAAALKVELALAAEVHKSCCKALYVGVSYVRVVGLFGLHFETLVAVRRIGMQPISVILDRLRRPDAPFCVEKVQACTRDVCNALHMATLGLAALHDRLYAVGSVNECTVLFERRGEQIWGAISADGARGGVVLGLATQQMVHGQRRSNIRELRKLLLDVRSLLFVRNPPGALQFERSSRALGQCDGDVRAALWHLSRAGELDARRAFDEQDTLQKQLERRRVELLQDSIDKERERKEKQREMVYVEEEQQRRVAESLQHLERTGARLDCGPAMEELGEMTAEILRRPDMTVRCVCEPRPPPVSQEDMSKARRAVYQKRQRGDAIRGPHGEVSETSDHAYMRTQGARWGAVLQKDTAGRFVMRDEALDLGS